MGSHVSTLKKTHHLAWIARPIQLFLYSRSSHLCLLRFWILTHFYPVLKMVTDHLPRRGHCAKCRWGYRMDKTTTYQMLAAVWTPSTGSLIQDSTNNSGRLWLKHVSLEQGTWGPLLCHEYSVPGHLLTDQFLFIH